MKNFQARLYTPGSKGEFKVVSLRVERQSIVIVEDGKENLYPMVDFRLDLTGQDGDKIRLQHTPTGNTIIASDKGIVDALQLQGSEAEIGRTAKKVGRDLKHRPAKKVLYILSAIGVPLGIIAIFYLTFDVWVDLAMKNIPPSAEEALGEIYVKDEKLDQKSDMWKRVDGIGKKLTVHLKNCPYKIRFYIENKEELNAYAVPGGSIIVLSKLVKDAKSDDEIAGVIGHELGHVIHRDSLRHILHSGGLGLVLTIVCGGVVNNQQIQQFIPALSALESLNYSRAQEAAADRTGIRLTVRSGYNGEAIIDLFKRFAEDEPKYGKAALALLSDHPMSEDRIKMIRVEAEAMKKQVSSGATTDVDSEFQ